METLKERNAQLKKKLHKKVIFCRKMGTNLVYRTTRSALKHYFKNRYNPIFLGLTKEEMEQKGPVVVIGNHREVLDPIMISYLMKTPISWAALWRMFQGKESLFSSTKNPIACWFSAWFISAIGAHPISRSKDPDYNPRVNAKTFKAFREYLMRGEAVGAFAEGTLNREPHLHNILPEIQPTIFKLAIKLGVPIRPVSIHWIPKEYKHMAKEKLNGSRVFVIGGKLIETKGKSLDDVMNEWRYIVDRNIELAKTQISLFMYGYEPTEELHDQMEKFLGNNKREAMKKAVIPMNSEESHVKTYHI